MWGHPSDSWELAIRENANHRTGTGSSRSRREYRRRAAEGKGKTGGNRAPGEKAATIEGARLDTKPAERRVFFFQATRVTAHSSKPCASLLTFYRYPADFFSTSKPCASLLTTWRANTPASRSSKPCASLLTLCFMAIRIWLCLKAHSRPDSSSSISVFMSAP